MIAFVQVIVANTEEDISFDILIMHTTFLVENT